MSHFLRSLSLLSAGAVLYGACGPGVATPMPEPPTAFNLDGVNKPGGVIPTTVPKGDNVHDIFAAPGTVPARATVRVTNLDSTTPADATTAAADGSFDLTVQVADGQELRFEWLQNGERSAPGDAHFVQPDPTMMGFDIVASKRFDCLKLSPGFALDFGAETHVTLQVENGCGNSVHVANPRARLNLADFSLQTPLPLDIEDGASQSLDVDFARAATGLREDVLFVDVTLGAETIRYPITLRAQ